MSKLYMKQKVFSLGERFTVKDEAEQDKYFVEGSFMAIPKTFTITDTRNQIVGVITKKVFAWLPKFFVEVDGKELLTIQKEFTFFRAKYNIQSEGLEIQGDWWDKSFQVMRNGEVIASITEVWFTWGDTFEIEVLDETYEHIAIALVVAIDFVKDQERAAASSSN